MDDKKDIKEALSLLRNYNVQATKIPESRRVKGQQQEKTPDLSCNGPRGVQFICEVKTINDDRIDRERAHNPSFFIFRHSGAYDPIVGTTSTPLRRMERQIHRSCLQLRQHDLQHSRPHVLLLINRSPLIDYLDLLEVVSGQDYIFTGGRGKSQDADIAERLKEVIEEIDLILWSYPQSNIGRPLYILHNLTRLVALASIFEAGDIYDIKSKSIYDARSKEMIIEIYNHLLWNASSTRRRQFACYVKTRARSILPSISLKRARETLRIASRARLFREDEDPDGIMRLILHIMFEFRFLTRRPRSWAR